MIANSPDAGSLRIAAEHDIDTLVVNAQNGKRLPDSENDAVISFVADHFDAGEPQTVSLLGAMTIINETIVRTFNGSNIPEDTVIARRNEPHKVKRGLDLHGLIRDELLAPHPDRGRFGLINNHSGPTALTANLHGHQPTAQMMLGEANETAVVLHAVGTGIDTGPVIDAIRVPFDPDLAMLIMGRDDSYINKLAKHVFRTHIQGAEKGFTAFALDRQLHNRYASV